MDSQNIITVTNNLEELESDMNNWLHSLTYDQQRLADDACLAKYGCTNVELFNSIKANILKHSSAEEESKYMNEAVHIYGDNHYSDLEMENLFQKIKTSNFLQNNDENVVIIDDFLSDKEPDYNLEQLTAKYHKYTMLPPNYKSISNDYSIELWGRSVAEMYIYMKAKLQKTNIQESSIKVSNPDKLLRLFETKFNIAKENRDVLESTLLRIEAITSENVSICESAILDGITEDYLKEDSSINYQSDFMGTVITPFFTPDEYTEYHEAFDMIPADYCLINNGMGYMHTIKKLQENVEENESKILKLGWNPYVSFNGHNAIYAKNKQIKWFNENRQCRIVNLTEYSTNLSEEVLSADIEEEAKLLEPIYICLVHTGSLFGKIINKVKRSEYSHAGISFNATLNTIYSFGIKGKNLKDDNGLVVESLDDYNDKNGDCKLLVLAIYVHPDIKRKVERNIMWYIDHKDDTRYSIKNLFRIVLNKPTKDGYSLEMVCSQFVDTILKLSYIDITNKPSNLVAPCDLAINKQGVNVFAIYEGTKKDYNFKQAERKVKFLSQNLNFSKLHVVEPKIIVSKIKESRLLEDFNVECSNFRINKVLKEARSLLTPKPAIVTEVRTPIGFNKDGDVYIDIQKDLQKQYEESHRLLYMYDVSNLNGIKKELAKLFHLNNIIEKKLKKCKDTTEKKELTDLRARILNDYKTYFKIVCSADPEFDFEKYLKSTDYYDKTITIDNTTVKYTGSLIKTAVKALMKLVTPVPGK